MSAHTQGKLSLVTQYAEAELRDVWGELVACVPSHANGRRLAVCWNACQGIPTEVLEAQQSGGLPWSVADQIEARVVQADLVCALGDAVSTLFMRIEERHGAKAASEYPEVVRGRAAIARATGGKTT